MGVKTVRTPNRAISSIRRRPVISARIGDAVMTSRYGAGQSAAQGFVDACLSWTDSRRPLGWPPCQNRAPAKTGIFAPFEWMIAARYLRAKRQESFISVISLFSLIGIALGVATLIIVMSVMNGFKVELLKSILGLSGHVTIQSQLGNMADYDAVTARMRRVPGVVRAAPGGGRPGDGQPERRQYRA